MLKNILKDIGEREAIKKILSHLPTDSPDLMVGPGDDAAVIKVSNDLAYIVTCDAIASGIHFREKWCKPEEIGYKLLATNISDITAMGGIPKFALLTLAAPGNTPIEYIERISRGISSLAKETGIAVIGGDTIGSSNLLLDMTLIGTASPEEIIRLSTASPEEGIFVTGTLGDASYGLTLLETLGRNKSVRKAPKSVSKLLQPPVRTSLISEIKEIFKPTAMTDISDGLLRDITKISSASNVGVFLEMDKLPLSEDLEKLGEDGVNIALYGGEEYELLFTASIKNDRTSEIKGIPITYIGKTTKSEYKIINKDGCVIDFPDFREDHFK